MPMPTGLAPRLRTFIIDEAEKNRNVPLLSHRSTATTTMRILHLRLGLAVGVEKCRIVLFPVVMSDGKGKDQIVIGKRLKNDPLGTSSHMAASGLGTREQVISNSSFIPAGVITYRSSNSNRLQEATLALMRRRETLLIPPCSIKEAMGRDGIP